MGGAAGEAGVFGEILIADADGSAAEGLLAGEPQVNEEGGGSAVVAGEVAEKGVEDVVVDLGHAVPTINIAINGQLRAQANIPMLLRMEE